MSFKEVTIDSVRPALFKDEWDVILKAKDSEQYLPVYVESSQADMLKKVLIDDESRENEIYSCLAARNDTVIAVLKSVIVNKSETGNFNAILVMTANGNPIKKEYPIVEALVLGFKKKTPILVDDSVFGEAGVSCS